MTPPALVELAVWLAALLGSGYFLCRILTCFLTPRPNPPVEGGSSWPPWGSPPI